ncbi:MAG: hypothetical protein M4579_006855 [Chaenotheca gracillima]|nr:MAG: hypothetical protein M4579_006855 [Chaenotheca gracillima]
MGRTTASCRTVLGLFFAISGALISNASPNNYDASNYPTSDVVTRDVCVIGGGSSGTYAAIRLRDLGHSVVVVEAQDRLGGHTETYEDPVTKGTIDIGVIEFHNTDIVKNYFARFNVSLTKATFSTAGQVTEYVDYKTAKKVTGYTPTDPTAALKTYTAQLAKYPYLTPGFNLTYPVPNDLVLPFGDFVKKYDLGDLVMTIFNYGQGIGDLLAHPTVYVMKLIGLDTLANIQTGFLTTTRNDNSELYDKARAELKDDVLLSSRVVHVDRSVNDHTKVWVQGPSGVKLIKAKKILIAIPPKLDNLNGFDLSKSERSLFSQFGNSGYYTGVLRNAGIPDNVSITNIGPHTLYNLPALPAVYGISSTGVPGLHNVKYGSPSTLPAAQVEADIVASVKRLTSPKTKPEFAIFKAHTPFELTVSPAAIKNRFYEKLYALQGQRNTFYTGAAFHTQDSSLLWEFTEALLDDITGWF